MYLDYNTTLPLARAHAHAHVRVRHDPGRPPVLLVVRPAAAPGLLVCPRCGGVPLARNVEPTIPDACPVCWMRWGVTTTMIRP